MLDDPWQDGAGNFTFPPRCNQPPMSWQSYTIILHSGTPAAVGESTFHNTSCRGLVRRNITTARFRCHNDTDASLAGVISFFLPRPVAVVLAPQSLVTKINLVLHKSKAICACDAYWDQFERCTSVAFKAKKLSLRCASVGVGRNAIAGMMAGAWRNGRMLVENALDGMVRYELGKSWSVDGRLLY